MKHVIQLEVFIYKTEGKIS